MRIFRRQKVGLFRRGTALFLLLAAVISTAPACADSRIIDENTGDALETLARAALEKMKGTEESLDRITVRRNGQICGRGIPDEPSGEEPNYIGLAGYAAAVNNSSFDLEADGTAYPWKLPAYLLFEKRWYYSRELQHKTGVLVVRQVLRPRDGGRYTGRLQVIRLDSGELCWMDVENFVTVPYWFYPARRAVRYGSMVAVYRRKGSRLPTDEGGNPAEVPDDTNVLVPGNGVWDRRPPEGGKMMPGVIYEETVTEKDGTEVRETVSRVLLFPEEDLTMIY